MRKDLTNILGAVFAIALQSIVTYYYFSNLGVTWFTVVPFFITVQYLKGLINMFKK